MIRVTLFATLLMAASMAWSQGVPAGKPGAVPICTHATLHAASPCQAEVVGYLATITDGNPADPDRCTTSAAAGGAEVVTCRWNGSDWEEFQGAGGGGDEVSVNGLPTVNPDFIDGDVTFSEASNQVTASYAPSSVDATALATDSVGSDEIQTDAVQAAEIAAGAVGQSEIATDGVGAAEIAANSVGSSEIATGAVGADELASSGATPGAYGGISDVPAITVDADGRITSINGSGVPEGNLPSGFAIVAQSCIGLQNPCFDSGGSGPIQAAIDSLESSFPNSARHVLIYPKRHTSTSVEPYRNDVNCDLRTGHTQLIGIGQPQQASFIFLGGGSFEVRTGVWIKGTTTLSNCSAGDINFEGESSGDQALQITTAQDGTNDGNVQYVAVRNSIIQPHQAILGDVGTPGGLIEWENADGFVVFHDVEALGVCGGGFGSNDALLFVNNGAGGSNPRSRWEGGKLSIEGSCASDAATIRFESSYAETEFQQVSIGCEADPGVTEPNCIELAGDGANALFHNPSIAVSLVQSSMGCLFEFDSDATTTSILRIDGLAGANADLFTCPVQGHASVASGTNILGAINWSGSFGGSAPSASGGAGKCFPGWTAADLTTPVGEGGARWVCEAPATGNPGEAGVWTRKRGTITISSAPAATCRPGDLHIDTDETDDTNCATTADNSLCLCTALDTWTAMENN